MQFAVRYVVEHPPVRADVLHGLRQFDSYVWIVPRGNYIAFDLAFWTVCLCGKRSANEKYGRDLSEQATPLAISLHIDKCNFGNAYPKSRIDLILRARTTSSAGERKISVHNNSRKKQKSFEQGVLTMQIAFKQATDKNVAFVLRATHDH